MLARTATAAALAALLLFPAGCSLQAGVGGGDPAKRDDARGEEGAATAGERATAFDLDAPPGAYPVIRVREGRAVEIRSEPGGERVEVAGWTTEFGSPTTYGVVKTVRGWAAVSTPSLPNGRLGWIRLDRRRLDAGFTRTSIAVDLSARRAELRRGGRSRLRFPVTVGAPATATPIGRFAVTDAIRGGLHPTYGCCAIALSGNQERVPASWSGGSRIAIHGTDGAIGVAASLGCVRAADRDVSTLVDEVPLGAPVFIRA